MKQKHDISKMPNIDGAHINVLQSKWYREHTDSMAEKCNAMLKKAGARIQHDIVPGCLEIPLIAQKIIKQKKPDAVICIGVLMKGETDHYDMILQSCNWGMQKVALDFDVPLINGILPVSSLDQVEQRCADDDFNKGIEIALAAGEFIRWQQA